MGALRTLERERSSSTPNAARVIECLSTVAQRSVLSASALLRLHEVVCWFRAYPPSGEAHDAAEALLAAFDRRSDLRRFRTRLGNSGIATTTMRYRFFWMTARRLARERAGELVIDWEQPTFVDRLAAALSTALPWARAEAYRRGDLSARAALDAIRGADTDAVAFLRTIEASTDDPAMREYLHDSVDADYALRLTDAGDSRTTIRVPSAPVVFAGRAPIRARADLRREIARAPVAVERMRDRDAARALDAARASMVSRERDLAAFAWGNERDVVLVDDGDGLSFVLIGTIPERRLALPVVHGWLMLRNGMPIGYVQTDSLFDGCEVAFNVFPTFRGGEASMLFGRVIATCWHVFGARAFTIEPYQLGHDNEEGIESAAYWFYLRHGFAPRGRAMAAIVRRERERLDADRAARTGADLLRRFAREHVYWEPRRASRSVLPLVPTLALRLASRTHSVDVCVAAVCDSLGIKDASRWPHDERRALERLAPIFTSIPGMAKWSAPERQAAALVIRAKAHAHETEFLSLLRGHRRLTRALVSMLRRHGRAA